MTRIIRCWSTTILPGPLPATGTANAGYDIDRRPLPASATAAVNDVLADRPTAIVFDLDSEPVAWRELIIALKQNAATRRVPIIGLSDEPDRWRAIARDLGCDRVVDRSQAATALPKLLDRLAPIVTAAEWDEACRGVLSPAALEGIQLFNRGDYFEAHEALEAAWNAEPGPARTLYRGLLQIAVAYHHIARGNTAGARKVLLRMWQWLDPLPARCRGVDVDAARSAARRVQAAVTASTEPGLTDVDRGLLQPWTYTLPEADETRPRRPTGRS